MFDLSILYKRKIIQQNKDINEFFDEISTEIFIDFNLKDDFSTLLKSGHIALSTSAYMNLSNPKSAIALQFKSLDLLDEYINAGIGMGFNFSKFSNPVEILKEINSYLKSMELKVKRPPASIALLDINHPKIVDFITLKDNRDYTNWCFNLSVIIDDDFVLDFKNPTYKTLVNSMKTSGEPGVIFSNNKNFLCDCCAAAELKAVQGLTLGQINLSKFYKKEFDFKLLSKSANVLSLALKKIAPEGFISILGYQDLLNQMKLDYGSDEALDILEKSLKIIKENSNDFKLCISPSGATSRILKTTPAIDPDGNEVTYQDELNTMKIAQKYLDGGISKTILLKKYHTIEDVDTIIQYAKNYNLKGITVFPLQ